MTTDPSRREPPPNPILRAMAGWQPARVLMAANRLEVFNVLGKKVLPAGEVARRCGTHPRSTTLLLNACVALGFLRKAGDHYGNTPEGLGLLVRGKPTYIGDGINHQDWLWRTWTRLEDAVRTNRPVIAAPEPGQVPTMHRDFILAMPALSAPAYEHQLQRKATTRGSKESLIPVPPAARRSGPRSPHL